VSFWLYVVVIASRTGSATWMLLVVPMPVLPGNRTILVGHRRERKSPVLRRTLLNLQRPV
jgi:hypothetical protein